MYKIFAIPTPNMEFGTQDTCFFCTPVVGITKNTNTSTHTNTNTDIYTNNNNKH